MPIIKEKDCSGSSITLLRTERTGDNFLLPVVLEGVHVDFNQEEEINAWDTWEAREDDILICAYPKSGTHWVWEIVSMLLNGNAKRINEQKEKGMLELTCKKAFDNLPSQRVLNSHVLYSHLPVDMKKKKCKIILVMRNPKDVAVSFYNHHKSFTDYFYEGRWEDYLPRFLEGKVDNGAYVDYIMDWTKVINSNPDNRIHFLTYESLHKESINEIRRLAKFLNVNENDSLFESIADACNFSKMKKEKSTYEEIIKAGTTGMYRKGKVGNWKTWFTVAQNEMFDAATKDKLEKTDIQFEYEI